MIEIFLSLNRSFFNGDDTYTDSAIPHPFRNQAANLQIPAKYLLSGLCLD